MTALPPNAEAEKLLPKNSSASILYDTVLLPAEIAAIQIPNKHADLRIMFARVVGYLFLYPPSYQTRTIVQDELAHCKGESDPNQAVYDLGQTYLMDLILPLCKHRAYTPVPLFVELWAYTTVDLPSAADAPCQPLFMRYKRAEFQRIQEEALRSEPKRPQNISEAKGFVRAFLSTTYSVR